MATSPNAKLLETEFAKLTDSIFSKFWPLVAVICAAIVLKAVVVGFMRAQGYSRRDAELAGLAIYGISAIGGLFLWYVFVFARK